jgi:hypothetical protein
LGDILARHVCRLNLSLRLDLVVSSQLPQPDSPSVEDSSGGCLPSAPINYWTHLWHGECEQEETEPGKPEHLPESPSPAIGNDSVARDDRGDSWTGSCGETVQTHCVGEFGGVENVLEGSTTSSERWTSNESG